LQNDRRKQFAHNADFPQSLTLAFLIWNSSRRGIRSDTLLGERLEAGAGADFRGTPSPASCGMSGLRRKSCKIVGFKALTRKIFRTKDLASFATVL